MLFVLLQAAVVGLVVFAFIPVVRRQLFGRPGDEVRRVAPGDDAEARLARMEEAIIAMAGEIERLRAAQGDGHRYVSGDAESPRLSKPSQDDPTTA